MWLKPRSVSKWLMFLLFLACFSGSKLFAQTTYTWKSDSIGSWQNADLWIPTGIPGNNDGVIIGSGIVSMENATVTIREITLSGGTLTAAGAKLTVTERFSWLNGNMLGDTLSAALSDTVEIGENADFIIQGSGTRNVAKFYIRSRGYTTWNTSNSLELARGSIFENTPTATFEMQSDRRIKGLQPEPGMFISRGTLVKSAGGSRSYIEVLMEISGNIELNAGSLQLDGGGNLGNLSANIVSGSELLIRDEPFSLDSAAFSGNGTITVNDAPITLGNGDISIGNGVTLSLLSSGTELTGDADLVIDGILNWNRGKITGNGAITNNNLIQITGDRSKTVGKNLVNNGIIDWTEGGGLNFENGASLTNAPSASFNIIGDGNILLSSGTGSKLINNGTVSKTVTTGNTTIGLEFHNRGAFNINSGSIQLTGTRDSTGTIQIDSGTTLELLDGNHEFLENARIIGSGLLAISGDSVLFDGTYHGTGEFRIDGGVVTFDQPDTLQQLSMNGGTLNGNGALVVAGAFNWLDGDIEGDSDIRLKSTTAMIGTSSNVKYIRDRTVINEGSLVWSGNADLRLNRDAEIINETGATLTVQTDADVLKEFGAPLGGLITNRGTLIKSLSEGTTTIEADLQNSGEMAIRSGTLRFNQQIVNAGSGIISGTDTLNVQNATFTNNGVVRPGHPVGSLRVVNDLPTSISSVIDLEIQGVTPGFTYDQLQINSTAFLGGTLKFSVKSGFTPALTDTFFVMTYTSYSGAFANVTGPGGSTFSSGYKNNRFYITNINLLNAAPVALDDAFTILEDHPSLLNVLANDSDPDGDPLSVSVATSPVNGTVSVVADTSFLYTPAANFFGADSFDYEVRDPDNATNIATVYIAVQPANDPPVITTLPDITFDETETYTIDLDDFVSDADHGDNELSWSATVLTAQKQDGQTVTKSEALEPEVATIELVNVDTSDLQISIDPATHIASFTGSSVGLNVFTVRFAVSDPVGFSDTDTISVTVSGTLSPPVLVNPISDAVFNEDSGPVVVANDLNTVFSNPETTPLVFSAVSLNSNIQTILQGDQLSVVASQNYNGNGTVIVSANNTISTSDTFLVTVLSVNDRPVVNLPNVAFPADDIYQLDLDNFVIDVDNPDAVLLWTAQVLTSTTGNPNDLTISIDPVSHVAAFSVTSGNFGTYSARFNVMDPGGLSAADTITVSVTEFFVNTAPMVVNPVPDAQFPEDASPKRLPAKLSNVFFDPDINQTLSFSVSSNSADIVAIVLGDSVQISYPPDFNGSGLVFITATDDSSAAASDTVQVTILPVNDPPQISGLAQQISFSANASVTINLWIAVSDPETADSQLNYNFSSSNDSLLFSFNAVNGDLTLSANPAFGGTANLFVTVSDSQNAAASDTISVTVQPISGIDDDLQMPENFALQQNFPNPFNPETAINFQLPTATTVRLIVYNMLGQQVRELVNAAMTAGFHNVRWNGLDDRGNAVTSGIYFYRMEIAGLNGTVTGQHLIRKMVLMK